MCLVVSRTLKSLGRRECVFLENDPGTRSVPRNVEANSNGSAQYGVPNLKYLLLPENFPTIFRLL
jgi:hypothetical protein